MKKNNIAELLENCPKGMELYSPIFGEVYLDKIRPHLAIVVTTDKEYGVLKEEFLYDGRYGMNGECMLFPSKGKNTWEGFQRPFQDGDIVALDSIEGTQIFIFKEYIKAEDDYARCYMILDDDGTVKIGCSNYYVERLATEEEKQTLFKAIIENGYTWNAGTKTLEKLVEPKFKLGDNIRIKCESTTHIVTEVRENLYILDIKDISLPFENQDQWELVPNKFDISTLVPFESRVLVRTKHYHDKWIAGFFSHKDSSEFAPFWTTADKNYQQCIPYESNEHLLNTTDKCEDFYITWED